MLLKLKADHRISVSESKRPEWADRIDGMHADMSVEGARQLAAGLLAEALPRRWSHTVAVAKTAAGLASRLAPGAADEIVCAAWLHDIGYSPRRLIRISIRLMGPHTWRGCRERGRLQPRW